MKATALQGILKTATTKAQGNGNNLDITVTMKSGMQYEFNYTDNSKLTTKEAFDDTAGLLRIANTTPTAYGSNRPIQDTAWLDVEEIESVMI